MTIGNAIDAAYARDAGVLIGEGAARKVYLYNGVAYKYSNTWEANMEEFLNYQILSNHTLPFGIAIPKMELYKIGGDYVIAAEYIDGEKSGECYCHSECDCDDTVPDELLWAIRTGFNISDFAWGNFIKKDGLFYLIDMQY